MSSRRTFLGVAVSVVCLLGGCTRHRRPVDDGPESGTGSRHDEGREDAGQPGPRCLQPPWVAEDGDDGVQAVACAGEREFGFVLPGSKPMTAEVGLAFLEQHRDAIHAVPGVVWSGDGLCCDGSWPNREGDCISIGLRLCSTRASELIDTFVRLQRATAGSSDVAIQVSVALDGLLGPRCEPDSECGPVPYRETNTDAPPKNRRFVEPPKPAASCDDDGECVKAGCGNQCDHWSERTTGGTCEGRSELERAFCGCVAHQCAWFR